MNRIYKLIWSKTQNRLVVVAEGVRGSKAKKRTRKHLRLKVAASLAATTVLASPAWAELPTGGQIVAGSGSIATNGADMTVHQASQKMIANWQSFSIGAGNSVNFVQPNASAVTLNRVTGHNTSQILGNLNANGQVFLVNPNGVVIGNGAQVRTGGFVASTLDISDENFLAGHYRFEGVGGEIENLGNIEGNVVALIAPTVRNEGAIKGDAALAAGTDVLLDFDGDGLLSVEVKASTLQTLVENKGLIQADGGVAILTARGASEAMKGVVNNSGRIEAQTLASRNGRILLLADMGHGEVNAAGELTAHFVETSAAEVNLDNALKADTQGGEWLIDPTDFTIDAAEATSIQNGLISGSVTLSTAGAGSDAGDIHVNADIAWSANTLTLNADRDININAVLTASGTAGAAFNYGGTFGDTAITPTAGSNLNVVGGRVDISSTGFLAINGHSYTILNSRNELQNISNLAGHYALGSDIDASATASWNGGAGFAPIGSNAARFSGSFDGLGHTVSGLTINRPTADYVGLFGYAENATLRNVGLVGGSVTGHNNVGGLVGLNEANYGTAAIANAYVTTKVSGNQYVGGLVGYNIATTNGTAAVINTYTRGNVNGSHYVGGLIGFNWANPGTVTITNAYTTGNVTGTGSLVGGLIGNNESWSGGTSSLTNVYAMGNVSGSDRIGGLVGVNLAQVDGSAITITNAYATGSVTGSATIGALVGANSATNDGTVTVTNAYWNADRGSPGVGNSGGDLNNVEGKTLADLQSELPAGFDPAIWGNAGNQSTPYLKNGMRTQAYIATDPGTVHLYDIIHNIAQLQAMSDNLAGYYALGDDIDASVTAGWNCSGTDCAGFAPIGSNATGNANSRFTGIFDGLGYTIIDLTIDRSATDYVGMFGYAQNATLRNVGLVGGSTTGRDYVGRLVGFNHGNNGTASITNAFATGDVTGNWYIGGLVGYNYARNSGKASTENAYATGDVTGNFYIGGLAGYNSAASSGTANIANVYATGDVTATGGVTSGQHIGGLLGYNSADSNGTASVSHAYATGDVNGNFNVGGLVGSNSAWIDNDTASITNAYATGSVTGIDMVGGLVGYNLALSGSTASISTAYATGNVTGDTNVGGLLGNNDGGTLTASFWDTETSGTSISSGGTGLTTAQMRDPFGFIDAGWDFNAGGVWAKSDTGENNGYMMLRWQPGSYYDGYLRVSGNLSRTYGDTTNPDLSSLVTTAGTVAGTIDWGSAITATTNVGAYQWSDTNVLTLPTGNVYTNLATGGVSITPAALTVTANDAGKTYDGSAYSGGNGVTYSGFVNGEDESVLGGALAYGGSAQGAINAGTYDIAVSGLTATNYALTYIDGQLTITSTMANDKPSTNGNPITRVERDHDLPDSPTFADPDTTILADAPALIQTQTLAAGENSSAPCLASGRIMSGTACGSE